MGKPIVTADAALADLRRELSRTGYELAESTLRAFEVAERYLQQRNMCVFPEAFLVGLLETSQPVRAAVATAGGDADLALLAARTHYHIDPGAPFRDSGPYSDRRSKMNSERGKILDYAIESAEAESRKTIADADLLSAVLRKHEEEFPMTDNESWPDERLRVPTLNLGHIIMKHDRALDIKFDDLRKALYLPARPVPPWENAPHHLNAHVASLRRDHPDYRRNIFVIMSFAKSRPHKKIQQAITKVLASHGFTTLRADDCSYAPDVTTNILTYMHGCNSAIAVFERIESDTHNANVCFEIGYLTALGKPICLLKERTVPRLPSDLMGRIYFEFDAQRMTDSVRAQIERWLADRRMVGSGSA